ncbi:MAG: UvrB/UvrC motif-containing protein [Elusimicrobia bacterium]|nr:UvrB/UvrC motif-containing protein [Elusimicrobiota bacterium]
MMLCSNCKKNPACVHFKSVVNQQVTEWNLCFSCAQEKGIPFLQEQSTPLTPAPFQSLSELIAQLADEVLSEGQPRERAQCPACGLTYDEFHVRGRFGCSRCYLAFQSTIEPLLKHIHGQVRHCGKPYAAPGRAHFPAEEPLQKQLRDAVKREDFERAAEIRDKIRQIKEMK